MSITNYGDMTFDKSSRALFDEEQLTIFNSDTSKDKESYYYKIEDGELIIIYSDFGIPLEIKKLTENSLILNEGGFGNTEEERRR